MVVTSATVVITTQYRQVRRESLSLKEARKFSIGGMLNKTHFS